MLGYPISITTPRPDGSRRSATVALRLLLPGQVAGRQQFDPDLRPALRTTKTVPQSTTGNATILNPEQTAFIPATVPQKIPLNGPDHNNWAPRFGFAYRLPSRFVLRGGFGMYYNPNQLNSYTLMTTNPPFSTIFTYPNNITNPTLTLANPTPATVPGAPTRVNAVTPNPYLPNATMNQWSFGVERGLWRNAGIAVEYLGSHQYHLDRSFFNNTPTPGPGAVNDRRPNPNFLDIRTISNDSDRQL